MLSGQKLGNEFELDVDLLEQIDAVLNVAFTPTEQVQPPPFNAAVALECLAEAISQEIQDGNVTGFSIQWDGSKHFVITKSVKSETQVMMTAHETLDIK